MKLTILIPLAGNRTFRMEEGSAFPKILNEINGKLLLERSAAPLLNMPFEISFKVIVPEEQIKQFNLDKILNALDERITVIPINGETAGATCTTLLAIDHVDLDERLVVTSLEQIIDLKLDSFFSEFDRANADCGVLTFNSIHPRFSYVLTDNNQCVLQAAEKKPISRNAVAGLYYFRRAEEFFNAAKNTILDGGSESGYYLSNTINEYILGGKNVVSLHIPQEKYFHFFDSHNVEQYETSITSERMNSSLLSETKAYVTAFDSKNINALERFFSNEFRLVDPAADIVGKRDVLDYIKGIFDSCKELSFSAKDIFVDGKTSIIEFELMIDGKYLVGTDVIKWDNNEQMISMFAYLYEKQDAN